MTSAEDDFVIWQQQNAAEIKRALKLIKPTREHTESCIDSIEWKMIEPKFMLDQARIGYRSKLSRTAARRIVVALRRVLHLLNSRHLDVSLRFFPRAEIHKWKIHCEELAKANARKFPREKAEGKRLAAAAAYELLYFYQSREVAEDASDGSRFCKLAALLYGEPTANLKNQCRAEIRKNRKILGSK
jgi:hypothetical protein